MSIAEKVYKLSPYFLKVGLLNVRAILNVRKRYSKQYQVYLETYVDLWYAPRVKILAFQKTQLRDLLLDCIQFVPYYKAAFEKVGVTDTDLKENPYEALQKLPLLSKMTRKEEFHALTNNNPARPIKEKSFTSGTSGTPTEIYLDAESLERSFALLSRFFKTIGISTKERSVRFSGRLIVASDKERPPYWIYNKAEDQLFMSSYHLTAKNSIDYIKKLNRYKPTFIDGYPSAIYILANFINASNTSIKFKPKAISVTAETLYDYQRVAIEKAFGCRVYNQYASSEGSPFITECTSGNLHINEDSGIFEFLDATNQPAAPGTIAKMVVTSLRSFKNPLLRYDIGDSVLLPTLQTPCECGCKMPLVEKIVGREDDILWTEEKGYVGRMDTAYKGITGLSQSQLIQKTPLHLHVNNVIDTTYTDATEKLLRNNLHERLGKSIEIKMEIVAEIPLGVNGKFDAVKREFDIPLPS